MQNNLLAKVNSLVNAVGTDNPEELSRRLGIVVLDTDLPEVTRGFCLTLNSGRAIVVNNKLKRNERLSCIAHELGHAVLHDGLNYMFMSSNTCMVTGRYEREANTFAAILLLINKQLGENDTVAKLSKKLYLPESAVECAVNLCSGLR